jgi:hypothetical protein
VSSFDVRQKTTGEEGEAGLKQLAANWVADQPGSSGSDLQVGLNLKWAAMLMLGRANRINAGPSRQFSRSVRSWILK